MKIFQNLYFLQDHKNKLINKKLNYIILYHTIITKAYNALLFT